LRYKYHVTSSDHGIIETATVSLGAGPGASSDSLIALYLGESNRAAAWAANSPGLFAVLAELLGE
jgi:hypothetical protein